jgi:hypothetical protein
VALQQQEVAEEVVATAQFLLQQLILFGKQCAGKDLIATRDDAEGERGFGQRRQVRT